MAAIRGKIPMYGAALAFLASLAGCVQLSNLPNPFHQVTVDEKLEKALGHEGDGSADKHAKHYRDSVIPAMTALRDVGDELEGLVPHAVWPLATYREMLFIK